MSTPPPPDPVRLVISFAGWGLLRLPTDPDPSDELRGVSGYTFAFAGEPDLDRVLHLRPPQDFTPRSHSPALGVTVRTDGQDLPALAGAAVNLLGAPMLENRNWTLTLPGFEPIVPFELQVAGAGVKIQRNAPLNPADPDQPVWQASEQQLAAQGAAGMAYEPATVGEATGIWDSLAVVIERLAALRQELAELESHGGNPTAIAALQGRIAELEFAVANPSDRRVVARNFVERFGFPMTGAASVQVDSPDPLRGTLDAETAWSVSFWLGAWDPDLLCLYMSGALEVPYLSTSD